MFNKLLKYDFKHYVKLWPIGAGTALVMSVAGGFCTSRIGWLSDHDYVFLAMIFGLIILVSCLCLAAFDVLTKLLVSMRYARNCYSDEGFLTFTLPVKRSQVLNSKLLTGVLYELMTFAVLLVCGAVFGSIAVDNFLTRLFYRLHQVYGFFTEAFGALTVPCVIVLVLIIILASFLFLNVIYFCVTFAGIRVRKNKILAGIGIGYLIHVIIGFVAQIGLIAVISVTDALSVSAEAMPAAALTMLSILLVWLAGVNAAFYYSQLNMLENKLNLS